MKPGPNSFLRNSASLAFALTFTSMAHAATVTWVGDTNNDFLNVANWPGDTVLPSLSTDTWQVNGTGTQGNSTLNVSSALTFTGTAGKISFGTSSGNMSLSGSDITLFQGTGDGILSAAASGNTTTIANNIILGNGGNATNSLSSSGTGLLKVTGNITSGTGAAIVGNQTLSFGSTDAQNGNYEVTGNISKGITANGLFLTKRGTGTLTLSGTNEVASLSQNVAGSKIVIAGGTTSIKPFGEFQNNWGGGTFTSGTGPTVEVQTGGTLNADAARDIRTKLSVTGGTININASAPRLTWALTNTEVFNMTSGEMNYLNATGGTQYGVGFFNNSGSQSGGNFTINGRGATNQTFQVVGSSANATASYTVSGGILDVKGSSGTNGWINITGNSTLNASATVTVSGTGKLISRFSPTATSGGIVGNTSGAVQVLSLTGGTLVAGRIDATNLRGSAGGTNGTIVNNGTNIAPGDVSAGLVGRTNIVGNMEVSTGTLTIDLGGLTASSVFSEAASGKFDNLLIGGNLSLGGDLVLNLMTGYTPDFADEFKIIDITGSLSNFFDNVADGGTLLTAGGEGTFKVYSSGGDVFLSEFTLVPEPRAALLGGLGLLALLRRRRG